MFGDFMKTILKFAIAFEKKHKEIFVATHIEHIVKDMMGSDYLTGMSARSYYGHIRVAKIMLTNKSDLALVESLNGANAGSKFLGISV